MLFLFFLFSTILLRVVRPITVNIAAKHGFEESGTSLCRFFSTYLRWQVIESYRFILDCKSILNYENRLLAINRARINLLYGWVGILSHRVKTPAAIRHDQVEIVLRTCKVALAHTYSRACVRASNKQRTVALANPSSNPNLMILHNLSSIFFLVCFLDPGSITSRAISFSLSTRTMCPVPTSCVSFTRIATAVEATRDSEYYRDLHVSTVAYRIIR